MSKHSIRSGIASRPSACLQALERLDALLAAALGAQLLLVEREPRVALGQLEDPALVAALGGAQLDRPAAPRRERLGKRRRAADLALHDEQRRDRHRAAVVLEQELLGDGGEAVARLVLEVEALAVGEHAVAHLEDLRVGLGALDRDRDRVERADRLVGDALALEQRADRPQAVALARRLLEALLGGGVPHRALDRALDRAVAAGEEVDHAVDRARGTPPGRRSRRRAPRSA